MKINIDALYGIVIGIMLSIIVFSIYINVTGMAEHRRRDKEKARSKKLYKSLTHKLHEIAKHTSKEYKL